VKVTSKGRLETIHVTTAVGNMRGLVGVGMAAGSDLQQVMLNSLLAAYKNVVPVPLYRQHTIYHPVDLLQRKVGGAWSCGFIFWGEAEGGGCVSFGGSGLLCVRCA
jgi:ribosomal protein S5